LDTGFDIFDTFFHHSCHTLSNAIHHLHFLLKNSFDHIDFISFKADHWIDDTFDDTEFLFQNFTKVKTSKEATVILGSIRRLGRGCRGTITSTRLSLTTAELAGEVGFDAIKEATSLAAAATTTIGWFLRSLGLGGTITSTAAAALLASEKAAELAHDTIEESLATAAATSCLLASEKSSEQASLFATTATGGTI
jgi:hypothetical protein